MNIQSVLVVVAHPDDEALGCGGTIAALAKRGIPVHVCFLCGEATARKGHPGNDRLNDDILKVKSILNISSVIKGSFPNIQFNTVPHLELVQFIEKAIIQTGADCIITHHTGDLNDDHIHTSKACQAAARIYQRQNKATLKLLLFMEILSSTDWAFAGNHNDFRADTFFDISETLSLKMQALASYQGIMRDAPHSRSKEVITSLAHYRGAQVGIMFAEAFQTGFNLLSRL